MSERMAAERVAAEEDDVDREQERSDTDTELPCAGGRIGKPQCHPDVVSEDHDEQQRQIQEVPVDVLQDERKRVFAEVLVARFADGARRRIRPERLVIGAAVVIAGESEPAGRPEDQQRGRERQRPRPPSGFGPEPAVWTVAKEERRIKRREIRPELVMLPLKRGPRRIDDERPQSEKREDRLNPPGIAPHGPAERPLLERYD